MRPPLLGLALLTLTGCASRPEAGRLSGPLATIDRLPPAPEAIAGPTAVLFWLRSADTLQGESWTAGGHSLRASLAELRDVLEGYSVAVTGTNRKKLVVASGQGPTRTVMLEGLDYPWGVVLLDPPYPEQILTGPLDEGELADLAWHYFQLDDGGASRARIAAYGWGAWRPRRDHHQYTGSPAATIPSPATVCPTGCENTLFTTKAAAERTKSAGVKG